MSLAFSYSKVHIIFQEIQMIQKVFLYLCGTMYIIPKNNVHPILFVYKTAIF